MGKHTHDLLNLREGDISSLLNSGSTNIVDMSGANNMFGSIARSVFPVGSGMGFIPYNKDGGIINLGGSDGGNPKWLGLSSKEMQFWAYNYCSPLAGIIDRLAEASTNGIIKFIDEYENVVYKNFRKNARLNRIWKLLQKPNPWQTKEEFRSEQDVLAKIFGYCIVFVVGAGGNNDKSYAKHMFNLNPYFCTPVLNYEYNMYREDKGPLIKEWLVTIQGISYTIPASDVMLIKDGLINNVNWQNGLPISKVAGTDYFVSNICAAMEADNVLLKKKGPLGVFSYDQKPDMAGQEPMTPGEKSELQEDLRKYGLTVGQLQYVISRMPLKWNAMSFNVRDLMTKETVRQGIDGLCDRFSYPAELMSGKNATYENRDSAEKYMYQNNIIPYSQRKNAVYNTFFGLEDIILYSDYDHLPVLQEDTLKSSQAGKEETEALEIEWKNGQITWNQWQTARNRDPVSGMDIYYPEWAKKYGIELNPQKETKDAKDKTSSKN